MHISNHRESNHSDSSGISLNRLSTDSRMDFEYEERCTRVFASVCFANSVSVFVLL